MKGPSGEAEFPDADSNLGIIYANAGRLPEAMAQYRLAIADGKRRRVRVVRLRRVGTDRRGQRDL